MRHTYAPAAVLILAAASASLLAESSTQPTQAYPALQKKLSDLKADNDRLKLDNKNLTEQIANLTAEIATLRIENKNLTGEKGAQANPNGNAKKFAKARANHPEDIEVGMTLTQAMICASGATVSVKSAEYTTYEMIRFYPTGIAGTLPSKVRVGEFDIDNATQLVTGVRINH